MAFLPMNAKEMRDRGWNEESNFIYVCTVTAMLTVRHSVRQ